MGSYKMCLCFTRRFRSKEAEPLPDVREMFRSFTGGASHMTAEQLLRFMMEAQGESDATIAQAEAVIDQIRHRRHLGKFSKPLLSLEDFQHYIFSDDLNTPIKFQVHHDMTAPLSHYYIHTGHNSYLTGNQLSSDCSDVPIIKALERGVRVIELDMWPNSTKDNIDILHGRTLTTPVELIKCLKSIKEHAFSASPYPVVITLEDHLTPDLQAKVAEMVTQTFGEMLFTPSEEGLKEFPSPDSMKNKVIISTKPPKEYLESKSIKEDNNGSHKVKGAGDEEAWGEEVPELKPEQGSDDKIDNDQSDPSLEEEEEDLDDGDPKSSQIAAPEYKRLITIRAGKPKGGLKEALKVDPDTVRRLSMSEQQLEKASESHATDIVRFTQRNLLRVYPKGTRFDSSNYNPLIGWMHGAQMVAFNMQLIQYEKPLGAKHAKDWTTEIAVDLDRTGYGRSLWLMNGMFRANGGCGYVKKPDFLMKVGQHNEVFNPLARLPVKTTLKVKVYMGDGWRLDFKQTHFDTYSPPDFYARVGIAGVPADSQMKKTKTIEDDWMPIWNEEFLFPLSVPELALLRIEVHEYDMSQKDDFAGQTCLPISELKTGIRTVPLCGRKGEKYKSVKLLMRFEFV